MGQTRDSSAVEIEKPSLGGSPRGESEIEDLMDGQCTMLVEVAGRVSCPVG